YRYRMYPSQEQRQELARTDPNSSTWRPG
ncbi:MAG: helix-turn-helix domain-containing protein, partial [Salinivenus sp.]